MSSRGHVSHQYSWPHQWTNATCERCGLTRKFIQEERRFAYGPDGAKKPPECRRAKR